MAVTNDPNIFVVTPGYAQKAIQTRKNNKGKAPGQKGRLPWYLNQFFVPDLERLVQQTGTVIATTTKSGRPVFVGSVKTTEAGTKVRLTLPSGRARVLIIKPEEVAK